MSNEIIYTAGDRTPYTYLIGWQKLDKWYHGVRYAKGCHPGDLWVTYFTSSKSVDVLRKTIGEPDIITIRKTFICKKIAVEWENRVNYRIKRKWKSRILNIGISSAGTLYIDNSGAIRQEEYKENLRLYYANLPKEDKKIIGDKISKKLTGKRKVSSINKSYQAIIKILKMLNLYPVKNQDELIQMTRDGKQERLFRG